MTGVLVTGGTGKTGTALVRQLRDKGVPVRVASRHPAASDPDAIGFDWNDPATHAAALRGMDRVFLVPPVGSVDPLPLVEPFLRAARRQGVARLVMLGSAVVLPNAPSAGELIARVQEQPGWTVLRASGFMQNFLAPHPLGERIRRHGEIVTAAGDGKLGWIDAGDIAAVAAVLLADPTSHGDVRDYLLTGPQALSYPDTAEILTAHTGRKIKVRRIEIAEQTANYQAAGIPAEYAAALAAVEDKIRQDRESQVSTAVLDVTGRPARTFDDFAAQHASRWVS